MKISDFYCKSNNDHKLYLYQETKCLGHFNKEELRELSDAMDHHGKRLCELLVGMRSYIANPFGRYKFYGVEKNGSR